MKKPLQAMKWMLIIIALMTFTACSKINAANFDKIQNEMTTEQVKAILGKPTEIRSGGLLGFNGIVYIYQQDKTTIKITFIQGKVIGKDGSFAK